MLRFDLPSFCTCTHDPRLQTAFGNNLLSWECWEVLLRILGRVLCLICSLFNVTEGVWCGQMLGLFFFSPSLFFLWSCREAGFLPEKWKKKQNLRQRDIHPHPKNPQPESPQKPQTKSTPRKPRTTGLRKGSPKVTLKNRAYFILKKYSSLASVFWHN